jgi:hypothetical protein
MVLAGHEGMAGKITGGWPVTFPAVRPPLPAGWPGRFGLLEDRVAYDEDLAGPGQGGAPAR